MDPEQEMQYVQMAAEHPHWLGSEAPLEILQQSSYAGDEPTEFLRNFYAAGYAGWLSHTLGIPASALDPEQLERAALLLWIRACELYTSHVYERPNPDWDRPFFSDEGLY